MYPAWPTYVIILPWPWIISSISIIFSGENARRCSLTPSLTIPKVLTIMSFLKRRSTFNELLRSQGGGLNANRYIRLMALASTEVLFVFPMSLIAYIRNVTLTPMQPWHSWTYVHADWNRVSYITRFVLSLDPTTSTLMEVIRWCMPISAILFFIFFGLASEARKQYRQWWYACLKPFGVKPRPLSYNDNKDTPYVLNPLVFHILICNTVLLLQLHEPHLAVVALHRRCPWTRKGQTPLPG